jgi:hypothetical protein
MAVQDKPTRRQMSLLRLPGSDGGAGTGRLSLIG